MKFVEVDKTKTTRNGDVIEMCSEFVKSGIEVAEVTDWEGRYSSINNVYIGVKTVVRGYFANEIRVSKNGDHVFLERKGK